MSERDAGQREAVAEQYAFLFTDIEASTRLWEQSPRAMSDSLSRHDAILRRNIEEAGGRVFKTIGDAFCAVFDELSPALLASLGAQLDLRSEDWPDEARIRVRMAIHQGQVEARSGDFFGTPLNHVSRLLDIGFGGQILVSEQAAGQLESVLPEGVGLLDLKLHRLKDIGRPERVHQVLHAELPTEHPPLRSEGRFLHNLPRRLTSMVGRRKVMEQIAETIVPGSLVTITGGGGSGKTRVALQVAELQAEHWSDGAWLIELADVREAERIPRLIASTLGLRDEAGRSVVDSIEQHLANRLVLIVLDNCEHLADACAQVAQRLLTRCRRLALLATSREALRIDSEQVIELPPLPLPDPAEIGSLARQPERLMAFAAIRLFVERAEAVRPGFGLDSQNAAAVARLCQRLDGIPLAIELAAARITRLKVSQIEARLDTRLKLLSTGSRGVAERQRTLRATLDWSYDLLDLTEQRIMARLAAFYGGWSLEAAETVCSDDEIDEFDVLDALDGLVSKSMVALEARSGSPRYRFLETVREYASERLSALDESRSLSRRHLSFFERFAREMERLSQGRDARDWLQPIALDYENCRAAMSFSEGIAEERPGGLRIAVAMQEYWLTRGMLSEGSDRLSALMTNLDRMDDAALEAAARRARARIDLVLGNRARAISDFESAMAIHEARSDLGAVADCRQGLAAIAMQHGEYVEAKTLYLEALEMMELCSDEPGQAKVHRGLGNLAHRRSDLEESERHYRRALKLWTTAREPGFASSVIQNLAMIDAQRGDLASAKTGFEDALAVAEKHEDRQTMGLVHYNLAHLSDLSGDLEAASRHLESSLEIAEDIRDERGILYCLGRLGIMALDRGDLERAWRLLSQALDRAERLSDQQVIASAHAGIGRVCHAESRYEEALSHYRSAFRTRVALEDQEGIAEALEGWAASALEMDMTAEAVHALALASSIRETLESVQPEDERATVDRLRETASAGLGDRAFDKAWSEGHAMSAAALLERLDDRAAS